MEVATTPSRETTLSSIILLSGLLFFILPLPQWLDSAGLTIATTHLGISHPPGQALYAMLLHGCRFLPLSTPAWRIALIAALFLILGFSLLRRVVGARYTWWLSGLILWCFAAWVQGIRQEVYSLNFLLFATGLWLFAHAAWSPRPAPRSLYTLAFVAGLAFGNHTLLAICGFLPLFSLAFFSCTERSERVAILLWSLFFATVGLAVLLYLPIRANQSPLFNFGDPERLASFLWVVGAKLYSSYDSPTLSIVYDNLTSVLAIYLAQLHIGGFFLTTYGWYEAYKRNKQHTRIFGLLVLAAIVVVLPQKNFQSDNPDVCGYLLPGIVLFFAVGLYGLLQRALKFWLPHSATGKVWLLPVVLLLSTFWQGARNWPLIQPYTLPESDRFSYSLLGELPYGAQLFVGSFQTYTQLLCFQQLERLRPDIDLIARGIPGDARSRRTTKRVFVELAIREREGVYDTRLLTEQLRYLLPHQWFFELMREPVKLTVVKQNFAQQQRFWQATFPQRVVVHHEFRRRLALAHYLHGLYYRKLGYEEAANWEMAAAKVLPAAVSLTTY